MQVEPSTRAPHEIDADTVAVAVFEGEGAPAGAPPEVGELISSGEARAAPKALAVTHAGGRRWVVVGLGERGALTPERARVAAAVVAERARELATRTLCWQAPASGEPAAAG